MWSWSEFGTSCDRHGLRKIGTILDSAQECGSPCCVRMFSIILGSIQWFPSDAGKCLSRISKEEHLVNPLYEANRRASNLADHFVALQGDLNRRASKFCRRGTRCGLRMAASFWSHLKRWKALKLGTSEIWEIELFGSSVAPPRLNMIESATMLQETLLHGHNARHSAYRGFRCRVNIWKFDSANLWNWTETAVGLRAYDVQGFLGSSPGTSHPKDPPILRCQVRFVLK